ncbi:MAG: hypothetical protein I4O49_13280 [Janthinobacterium lividum]|nr:hypothetical protein [Janthinobacterium lividum]
MKDDEMNRNRSDLWTGIGGAIVRARGHSPIVIVEREESRFRAALAEHFIDKALVDRDTRRVCQAYVSMYGHPHLPAGVVSGGRRSSLADLAGAPIEALYGAELIAIDGPESMLATMPARLKRFISCCAQRAETVVILTESAKRLVDAGIDGTLLIIGVSTDQKLLARSQTNSEMGTRIQMTALMRPCCKQKGSSDDGK